ncbi:unnamed protein product [Choristocarpus tenellus]
MGGGNGQKSATARARNEKKKAQGSKGSQRAVNAAACNIICQASVPCSISRLHHQVCRQSFMNVSNDAMLRTHAINKHSGKKSPSECFPGRL